MMSFRVLLCVALCVALAQASPAAPINITTTMQSLPAIVSNVSNDISNRVSNFMKQFNVNFNDYYEQGKFLVQTAVDRLRETIAVPATQNDVVQVAESAMEMIKVVAPENMMTTDQPMVTEAVPSTSVPSNGIVPSVIVPVEESEAKKAQA
ncbi:hypothetical protein TKK_0011427 [Trichogramma kaykai]